MDYIKKIYSYIIIMPKLRNAELVYNPNSEYGASKTLTALSLSNMANGMMNPDTASNITTSEKEAKAKSYAQQFISGLEQIKLLLLSVVTYHKQGVKDLVNTYGIDNPQIQFLIQDYAESPIQMPYDMKKEPNPMGQSGNSLTNMITHGFKHLTPQQLQELSNNPINKVGSGRIKGSKNKQKPVPLNQLLIPQTMWGSLSAENQFAPPTSQNLVGSNPATRFSPSMQGTPLPSVATNSIHSRSNASNSIHSVHSGVPSGSDSDSESDSESVSSQGSIATSNMMGNLFNSADPSDDDFSDDDDSIIGPNHALPKKLPIADAIIRAASLIEKVNVYFLSKLKPIFNYLDKIEIDKIIQATSDLNEEFNRINHVYIGSLVENGDMVYDVLRTRIKKLILDVYVAYKGYAPPVPSFGIPTLGSNIPRFKATPKSETDSAPKIGSGITNFIPTDFNRHMRSIPTKYLL
jgi:hypothetical protein